MPNSSYYSLLITDIAIGGIKLNIGKTYIEQDENVILNSTAKYS